MPNWNADVGHLLIDPHMNAFRRSPGVSQTFKAATVLQSEQKYSTSSGAVPSSKTTEIKHLTVSKLWKGRGWRHRWAGAQGSRVRGQGGGCRSHDLYQTLKDLPWTVQEVAVCRDSLNSGCGSQTVVLGSSVTLDFFILIKPLFGRLCLDEPDHGQTEDPGRIIL